MNIQNREIREIAKASGVRLWEVGLALGVNDTTFSKWMRKEFTPTFKDEVLHIIEEIAKRGGE